MKKLLLLILALAIALCVLASCGGDNTPSDNNPPAGENNGGENNNENNGGGEEVPPVKYTVTWKNETGTTLKTEELTEGTVPSYTYTKADTAEWDYTVLGWSLTADGEVLASIPAASENVTYYAVVSQVKQKYTVTFDLQGGEAEISPVTVEYGQTVAMPTETPLLSGYKFMGWSSEQSTYVEVDFTAPVVANKTVYAIYNEVVDISAFLSELLSGYEFNPYSYIPETLLYTYSNNLVDPDDLVDDYSSFVNVNDITFGGFGEQWHMIADNINQSQVFFNVLSIVEGLTSTSLAAFNNYIDQNPADTAHHNFASGIYSITVSFNGSTIYYVIDYTADIPVLGNQTVQIAMNMNIATKDKTVRVQIGDANALTYVIRENSYEFGIRYLGVRRAYFSVERDANGNVEGHINEYLTVSAVEIASAADFYIGEDYAYAVGNKADAFIGFTGYICEVYDVKTGKMIGYEIQETLSAITYNTLWFNLEDITGIQSIKYIPATDSTAAAFYVNGSSDAWANKKVGILGGLKAASRRFDIEFRTQYFYSYDPVTETYTAHAVQVPMFFVQEEYYDDLVSDVKSTNKITISVALSDDDLDEIMQAYDTTVPVFIENKEKMSVDAILAFIGTKVTFDEE